MQFWFTCTGHQVYHVLQRGAQLPLLLLLQPVVQRCEDHQAKLSNRLQLN